MQKYNLDPAFHIERMTLDEFKAVIKWTRTEGWNPGINDAEVLYGVDPEGFLIGKIGDELVCSVTAVIYQKMYAFMGMYIVHPKYRGQGYGIAMWQEAMRRLEELNVEMIAMEATMEQIDHFKKSGFEVGYFHDRFVYHVTGGERETAKVWDVTEESKTDVCEYDAGFHPEVREGFAEKWLQIPGVYAVYWSDRIHGKIMGYGVIREAAEGYRVGPLYAHDVTVASEIFEALCSKAQIGARLCVDIPETNDKGIMLMKNRCGEPCGRLARMYKGKALQPRLNEMFGLYSVKVG
ncbi:GNAT family N-acetyltransferase [Planctomycetota bacterium]|nr:GNAT family N-acetyltransferase [Planctomycetota bacterium]